MPWYAIAKDDFVDTSHGVRITKGKEYRVSKDTETGHAVIILRPLTQGDRKYYMVPELARTLFNKPDWRLT